MAYIGDLRRGCECAGTRVSDIWMLQLRREGHRIRAGHYVLTAEVGRWHESDSHAARVQRVCLIMISRPDIWTRVCAASFGL